MLLKASARRHCGVGRAGLRSETTRSSETEARAAAVSVLMSVGSFHRQAARHDDLLLVAAAERGDRGVGAGGPDAQAVDPAVDEIGFAARMDRRAAAEAVDERQRQV